MAEIEPPRRDEALIEIDGTPTLRFSEYLEGLAISVNQVTSETIVITSQEGEISNHSALISQLQNRIEEVEDNNDNDVFNSRIAQINATMTQLVDELIEEVRKLGNTELANKAVALQEKALDELQLLNLRTEEAFDTGLDMGDVE